MTSLFPPVREIGSLLIRLFLIGLLVFGGVCLYLNFRGAAFASEVLTRFWGIPVRVASARMAGFRDFCFEGIEAPGFMTAGRACLRLGFPPGSRGRWAFDRLTLRRPQILLTRAEDGRLTLGRPGAGVRATSLALTPSGGFGRGPSPGVLVSRLFVEDGRLRIFSEEGETLAEAGRVWGWIDGAALPWEDVKMPFVVTLAIGEVPRLLAGDALRMEGWIDPARKDLVASAEVSDPRSRRRIGKMSLLAAHNELRIRGRLPIAAFLESAAWASPSAGSVLGAGSEAVFVIETKLDAFALDRVRFSGRIAWDTDAHPRDPAAVGLKAFLDTLAAADRAEAHRIPPTTGGKALSE